MEFAQLNNSFDLWKNAIYQFLSNWFNDSDFIIAHSSGSTGTPKEIRLSKVAMQNSARMTNAFFGLNSSTTALLCLPATYIAGKMMLVRALVGGFNLLTVEPNANPFLNLSQPIDFTAITPYQLNNSLSEIRKIENRSSGRMRVIVGGAAINNDIEAAIQSFETIFYETYGMTETYSHIALRAVNGTDKSAFFSILNGIKIRTNENNCLCIKAPHLFKHEIETTDIVEIFNQNSFKWIGRLDHVINSGGIKIFPEKLEQKLRSLIQLPFFISSIPDDLLGQKVVLAIESAPFSTDEQEKLKSALILLLEKYEQPKKILFMDQFVYSESNKILKQKSLQKVQY